MKTLGRVCGAVGRHLQNWAEIWLWIPLSLLAIPLAAKFAYFLQGRKPEESADWLVALVPRLIVCVLVIVLVSIMREQTGVWLRKEDLMTDPRTAIISQTLNKCVFAVIFAYVLLH